MRPRSLTLALFLALVACGAKTDPGKDLPKDLSIVWIDQTPASLEAGPGLEGGAAKEAGQTGSEAGAKAESGTPTPDQATTPSGLGAICTGTCAAADEICVFRTSNTSKGVCLKKCNAPNTPCTSPDPKYFLPCLTYTSSLLPAPVNVCAIACQFQGTTYPCPNAVDYTCKSYGAMSVCVPK